LIRILNLDWDTSLEFAFELELLNIYLWDPPRES
jgi:hypothetical protein